MLSKTERLFQKQVNLYRLQEKVDNLIMGAQGGSHFRLTEDVVKSLHKIAMTHLLDSAGEYRDHEVSISNSPHQPPSWVEVPVHMQSFCKYLTKNWEARDLVHLAAFTMWRLNWVHPFGNGNGRTARAASYLVLCAKHGQLLPPKESIISQIQRDKVKFQGNAPYYEMHRQADNIYRTTSSIDQALVGLEAMLSHMLKEQIKANF